MDNKRIQDINKWFLFPDSMTNGKFLGYITKDDITQIRGGFPIGQNIDFTSSQTPTVRKGCELIGTENNINHSVKRAWNFERRDGVEIEMKTYNTGVYFIINGVMSDYQLLEDGFTADQEFGYAVISEETDVHSRVSYCNGIEDWRVWNGVYAKYLSDNGSDQITTDGIDLFGLGFAYIDSTFSTFRYKESGVLGYKGNQITYTGLFYNHGYFDVIENPLDGETISINGATITFKDTISAAGTVKIEGNGATTLGNLYDLMINPGVTDAKHVALSVGDQALINACSYVVSYTTTGGKLTITKNDLTKVDIYSIDASNYFFSPAYTGVFLGCSAVPSTYGAIADEILTTFPTTLSESASVIKSKLAYANDGRIFGRNEKKPSVVIYSKLDDPNDFTAGDLDGDGGTKDIEQGGAITAFANDEGKILIFKNKLIKTLEFIQFGAKVDYPKWGTIKPSNDKSTTVGARGQKSTFAAPNGVIFCTLDNQLIYLKRQETLDFPQQQDIADAIRPTFFIGVHDDAAGIVYNSKVYYAYKQDANSDYNDTVIVYDLIRNIWSEPYVDWCVSDWTIVNGKLRWHSSNTPNSYEVIDDHTDNTIEFVTILRSWNETFGMPETQKRATYVMIELYMQENSEITATILYDENGYSGQEEHILKGTDEDNKVGAVQYNPFGANPFGIERFGSNADLSKMNKYRYIIELKNNIDFFNIALQLSTVLANNNYEMIRFGYFIYQTIMLPLLKYIK